MPPTTRDFATLEERAAAAAISAAPTARAPRCHRANQATSDLWSSAAASESAPSDKARVVATWTMSQLARAAARCDMDNEHGRAGLEALSADLMKTLSTPDEALAPLFSALEAACLGEATTFQRRVAEAISEVEDPLETIGAEPTDAAEADARAENEQAKMFAQVRLGEIKNEVVQVFMLDLI